MHPNPLEQYLDRVERHLTLLTEDERREWREEARQHLESLVEAHLELGRSPGDALSAAIAQFGAPEVLGKELTAYSSVGLRDRRASYFVMWSVNTLSWNVMVTVFASHMVIDRPNVPGSLAVAVTVFCLGHALGGALFGWQTRMGRLGRAVGLPYLALFALGMGLTGAVEAFTPAELAGVAAVVATGLALGSATANLVSGCYRKAEPG